jgi:cobalamin biosynthesis Mg chelatase CobN
MRNLSSLTSVVLVAIVVCDCFHAVGNGAPPSCPPGNENCACLSQETCNGNLVCTNNVCVTGSGNAASSAASSETSAASTASTAGASSASSGGASSTSSESSNGSSQGSEGESDGAASSSSASGGQGDGGSSSSSASTSTGNNLIVNGDFSQGTAMWGIVYGSGTINVTGGELCATLSANQKAVLAWPQPAGTAGVSLGASVSYTLSYSARVQAGQGTPAPVGVDAKVGQTAPPNTADFETQASSPDNVTPSSQTFTHTFTPAMADSSAGVAFTFQPTVAEDVCFQNVQLVQN